ncbi:FAD-binding oxidoreductase [Lysobacter firmicutimachus]|uniref:FAD-binding oxidoreductase n=1 Tax=Lysobacter firmicutimachus TaxID=1792846 RepID=UPI003CE46725
MSSPLNQLRSAVQMLALGASGSVRRRSEPGYDAWLCRARWNERDVDRRPDYIVRPRSVDDMIAVIRTCREHGLAVALRSGGHSFANAFIRRNGVLLDLSALRALTIDSQRKRAIVGPGVTSRDLSRALAPYGLGFATGHSGTVGLGGFLLGGGLGINFGQWGPMSAFHIKALDVVTADGVLRRASAEENSDLFWAARGGGPMVFFCRCIVRARMPCRTGRDNGAQFASSADQTGRHPEIGGTHRARSSAASNACGDCFR